MDAWTVKTTDSLDFSDFPQPPRKGAFNMQTAISAARAHGIAINGNTDIGFYYHHRRFGIVSMLFQTEDEAASAGLVHLAKSETGVDIRATQIDANAYEGQPRRFTAVCHGKLLKSRATPWMVALEVLSGTPDSRLSAALTSKKVI
jgi:hypothetical protein